MKRTATALSLIFLASNAWAETQLDAHEHGVGQLNIAIEGTKVLMEFTAPGADIVGFEYQAKSDEDHAAIDAAIEQLESPLDLFVMASGANCTLDEAHAALEGDEGHDHDEHDHDEHDDHDHADHDEHDDHDHDDHDDHADHDDHDHDDHAEDKETHTEFHAEYALSCANPKALDRIEFPYFETFKNAHELEIVLISDSGATSYEVDHDNTILSIGG